jgi:hypothetical protein
MAMATEQVIKSPCMAVKRVEQVLQIGENGQHCHDS